MGKTAQDWADLFGAKLVGQVPDVGGGPFGMARLAHFMHERLTPSRGERPGRPTDPVWEIRPKVPMSQNTHRRLVDMARQLSTPDRQVSPMQVAAQLLEMALSKIAVKGDVTFEEIESDRQNLAAGTDGNREATGRSKRKKTTRASRSETLKRDRR